MLDFIRKSPLGFVLTAVALVLVASPRARETARNWVVKGTATVLDLVDQAKDPTKANTGFPGQSNVYDMEAYGSASKTETTVEPSASTSDHPTPPRLDPDKMPPS